MWWLEVVLKVEEQLTIIIIIFLFKKKPLIGHHIWGLRPWPLGPSGKAYWQLWFCAKYAIQFCYRFGFHHVVMDCSNMDLLSQLSNVPLRWIFRLRKLNFSFNLLVNSIIVMFQSLVIQLLKLWLSFLK